MQHYKNNPNQFKLYRNRILSRALPFMAIIVTVGLGIAYYSQGANTDGLEAVLGYMAVIVLVLGYGVFKGLKKQREMFDSYELIIAPDHILRRQAGLADKKILLEEVLVIEQMKNGYLCIKGEGKQDVIAVSPYIVHFEEAKETLEVVKQITPPGHKSSLQKYLYVLLPLMLISMGVFYISTNKIAIAVSGTLLIVLLGRGFYNARTSTLIDKKAKRNAWWMLVVILSIMLALYYRVFVGDLQ